MEAYEKEVALLIRDIHAHIADCSQSRKTQLSTSAHQGRLEVENRPSGVNVIICGPANLLRYGLSPLAASIAAGNVTLLATPRSDDLAPISCIQRLWSRFLDVDSLFFLPAFEASTLAFEDVDRIVILGEADPSSPLSSS